MNAATWISCFRHGAYTAEGAHRGAILSSLTYSCHDHRHECLRQRGLTGAEMVSLESGNSQCFILSADSHACVCVRGTSLPELQDLQDDLNVGRSAVTGCPGSFHAGFDRHATRLLPGIRQELNRTGAETVSFHGHSLGAAASVRLAMTCPAMVSSVWLYGCPHTTDKALTQHYDQKLGDRTFPHQNNNDPVCWVPLLLHRVGMSNLRYITHDGRVLVSPGWAERLRDARRGALKALWSLSMSAALDVMSGKSLTGAVSGAIYSQMQAFDHNMYNYVYLTGSQPLNGRTVSECEE